jgi:hypothetical protein
VDNKLNEINFKSFDTYLLPDTSSNTQTQSQGHDEDEDKYENIIQTAPKSYKLDSNTKVFTGAPGERLSQWLFIINDAFTSINVESDKIKLALITNYLRGGALNTLIRYRSDPNLN